MKTTTTQHSNATAGYTPGPWTQDRNVVTAPRGVIVASCPLHHDARLIAAAPDMLEALEAFVRAEDEFRAEAFNAVTMDDALADAYNQARAALQLAKQ